MGKIIRFPGTASDTANADRPDTSGRRISARLAYTRRETETGRQAA